MAASFFHFTIAQEANEKNCYQELKNTPDGFVQSLVERGHKIGSKDGTAIILAMFDPNKHHIEQKNVVEVTGLALDFDGKSKVDGKTVYERLDVEAILAKLPFKGVAHTSYSHTSDHPKFRVLIPLAEPISLNEHRRLWWWFYELTGKKADPSGKNCDRIFFLPRVPDAEALKIAWIRALDGPILDYKTGVPVDYVPPEQARTEVVRKHRGAHRAPSETRTYNATDPQLLLKALAESPLFTWACENPSEVTREVWRGIATNIAAAVLEDETAHEDGAALFHEISAYDSERYDWSTTEKTFRDALRSAQSYGPVTFQHLVTNGAPVEVCDDHGLGAKSPLGVIRMTVKPKEAKCPKVQAPVEPGKTSSKPSETSPSSSPKLVAVSEASKPPSASSTSSDDSVPPDADAVEEDFLKFNFDRILFNREGNKWHIRSNTGEWADMAPAAFNEMLNGMGVPPKRLASVRGRLRQYQFATPVWDKPDEELVNQDGFTVLNTYKKSTLEPKPGDWTPIRRLLENLCGEDMAGVEYVLDWLAAPVQSLRLKGKPLKMGTALVFHGDPGSGKGTLSLIMEAIYGDKHAVTIGQNELDNRFNGELLDKLFVVANEIISSTNRSGETANKIKPWITDPKISIEQKFMGSRSVKNEFNIIFTSNDERPVIVEKGDRRFTVFRSTKLDDATGQAIYADFKGSKNMVAAFLDHLMTRQVNIRFGQLYISAAKLEMMAASAPSEERFVQAILEDGWLSVSYDWVDAAPNGKIREAALPDGFVLSNTLKAVYEDFCRRNNIRPRGSIFLGKAMKRTGADATRQFYGNVQQRGWRGIPLRSPEEILEPKMMLDEDTSKLPNNI